MLAFAKLHKTPMEYLPIEKEISRLPREYVANVLISLQPSEFATMVAAKMMERHKQYKSK